MEGPGHCCLKQEKMASPGKNTGVCVGGSSGYLGILAFGRVTFFEIAPFHRKIMRGLNRTFIHSI